MKTISVYNVVLTNKPLSNVELLDVAKKIEIPGFRGVFMRNNLPSKPRKDECGILNLDDSSGTGTHKILFYIIQRDCNRKTKFSAVIYVYSF